MANILEFKAKSATQKKKSRKKNANQQLMCRNGHHQWQVKHEQKFDVKQGKLVTVLVCSVCGKTRQQLL